jgi:hypothetical protein
VWPLPTARCLLNISQAKSDAKLIGALRPFLRAPKTALLFSTSVPSPRVDAEDDLDTNKAADRGRGAISMTIAQLSQYMGFCEK